MEVIMNHIRSLIIFVLISVFGICNTHAASSSYFTSRPMLFAKDLWHSIKAWKTGPRTQTLAPDIAPLITPMSAGISESVQQIINDPDLAKLKQWSSTASTPDLTRTMADDTIACLERLRERNLLQLAQLSMNPKDIPFFLHNAQHAQTKFTQCMADATGRYQTPEELFGQHQSLVDPKKLDDLRRQVRPEIWERPQFDLITHELGIKSLDTRMQSLHKSQHELKKAVKHLEVQATDKPLELALVRAKAKCLAQTEDDFKHAAEFMHRHEKTLRRVANSKVTPPDEPTSRFFYREHIAKPRTNFVECMSRETDHMMTEGQALEHVKGLDLFDDASSEQLRRTFAPEWYDAIDPSTMHNNPDLQTFVTGLSQRLEALKKLQADASLTVQQHQCVKLLADQTAQSMDFIKTHLDELSEMSAEGQALAQDYVDARVIPGEGFSGCLRMPYAQAYEKFKDRGVLDSPEQLATLKSTLTPTKWERVGRVFTGIKHYTWDKLPAFGIGTRGGKSWENLRHAWQTFCVENPELVNRGPKILMFAATLFVTNWLLKKCGIKGGATMLAIRYGLVIMLTTGVGAYIAYR